MLFALSGGYSSSTFGYHLSSAKSPPLMECQICFDETSQLAGNPTVDGALCRRSCPASVCASCLARHVQVSLASSYAGILPRVCCPVCLVPIRMERWLTPLRADQATARLVNSLRYRYKELCRQACSLRAPCCENVGYTHLPDENLRYRQFENPLSLPPSKVLEFRKLVARFCAHRVEPRHVIAFSISKFGAEDTRELMERALRHISDDERRARLMLSYLYQFPKIHTLCCYSPVCFNCKRRGHHDKCEDFSQPVDEGQCLLRCRSCHVLLMKVEGCNAVSCVCGFQMSWSDEIARRDGVPSSTKPQAPARQAVRRRR